MLLDPRGCMARPALGRRHERACQLVPARHPPVSRILSRVVPLGGRVLAHRDDQEVCGMRQERRATWLRVKRERRCA